MSAVNYSQCRMTRATCGEPWKRPLCRSVLIHPRRCSTLHPDRAFERILNQCQGDFDTRKCVVLGPRRSTLAARVGRGTLRGPLRLTQPSCWITFENSFVSLLPFEAEWKHQVLSFEYGNPCLVAVSRFSDEGKPLCP